MKRRIDVARGAIAALAIVAAGIASADAAVETEPNDDAAQSEVLPLDDVVSGTIGAAGDHDVYRFSAGRGDRIVADVDAAVLTPASALDAEMVLLDTDGESVLTRNDDFDGRDSHIDYVLRAAGTYYVLVRQLGDGSGSAEHTYQLRADLVANTDALEPNDDAASAVPIADGDSLTGVVSPPGDRDTYVFTAGRGDRIIADIDARVLDPSSPLDAEILLLGADGVTVVASNDDHDGYDSRLDHVLTVDGVHYLRVIQHGEGDGGPEFRYGLSLRVHVDPDGNEANDEPAAATQLTLPAVVDGAISPSGDRDVFAFTGTAGDTITADIDARSLGDPGSPLDSELILLDTDGETVLMANDDADGYDSGLEFVLPAHGTYYLRVIQHGEGAGGPEYVYRLAVSTTGQTAPLGLLVRGVVGVNRYVGSAQVTVNRRMRLEVLDYRLPDQSDSALVAAFDMAVPAALGAPVSADQLRLTTVAGIVDTVRVSVGGLTADLPVETLPGAVQSLQIEPQDVRLEPGETVDFDARGVDKFGNVFVLRGMAVGWHCVPADLGQIHAATGRFTAGEAGGGYVVAVSSRGLKFGDTGAGTGSAKVAVGASVPAAFDLHPNWPNPFNPETQIAFDLPRQAEVRLTIYNAAGQEVATLVEETLAAGRHQVTWQAAGLPSGVYLCRLQAAGFAATRKLLLVR